jgi:NSS family neurotransmitter:Na+ symporter
VFFLGLFLAALSSLIAMLELSTRIMMDFGLSRKKALPWVCFITAVLGLPSAISYQIFKNQDWVWGLGLIISGSFFAMMVLHTGVRKFRQKFINVVRGDLKTGKWFDIILKYVIPIEAVILIAWWLYRSIGWHPEGWYNPLQTDSLGTCIFQWVVVMIFLILFNRIIIKKLKRSEG